MPPAASFDIFISFRFAEAEAEAKSLKAALEARRLRVFTSDDLSPGDELGEGIAEALANCRLAVMLATRTYGKVTNNLFDTAHEMKYILSHRKPCFLIRMIPFGEAWETAETELALPESLMQREWAPGEPMPAHLVEDVMKKLADIAPSTRGWKRRTTKKAQRGPSPPAASPTHSPPAASPTHSPPAASPTHSPPPSLPTTPVSSIRHSRAPSCQPERSQRSWARGAASNLTRVVAKSCDAFTSQVGAAVSLVGIDAVDGRAQVNLDSKKALQEIRTTLDRVGKQYEVADKRGRRQHLAEWKREAIKVLMSQVEHLTIADSMELWDDLRRKAKIDLMYTATKSLRQPTKSAVAGKVEVSWRFVRLEQSPWNELPMLSDGRTKTYQRMISLLQERMLRKLEEKKKAHPSMSKELSDRIKRIEEKIQYEPTRRNPFGWLVGKKERAIRADKLEDIRDGWDTPVYRNGSSYGDKL